MGGMPKRNSPGWTDTTVDYYLWKVLAYAQYPNAYVLKVQYKNIEHFEGIKIIVYRGSRPQMLGKLDPHFADDSRSPIARFRPSLRGWADACAYAEQQ